MPTCLPVRDTLLRLCAVALLACAVVSPAAAQDDNADPAGPALREIVITGNTKTDPAVILRIMDLEIGAPFDLETMDRAWDALEDSGYFQFVDMADEEDDAGGVVLHVSIEEDLSTYYGPLLRPDRRFKYLLGGWLEERNLRGKAETVRVEAAPIYIQHALASWRRPWLAGVRGLEARVWGQGEAGDFVFRPTRYRKWDAGLDLRWDFAQPLFVRGGAAYGHFLQRDAYTGAPAGGENHWRLEAAAGLDTRDNPAFPRRGAFVEAAARRWTSNGFADYTETSLDARLFWTVPWAKHILALHGWGRSTDGPAQLDNTLFLGGPHSIRGYDFGTIDGDEGWVLSAEYRMPLFLMPISPQGDLIGFGLHVFADAGDAWFVDGRAGRPAQGWGFGAHILLDALQLRFEEATGRDGIWRFEFSNGFNF